MRPRARLRLWGGAAALLALIGLWIGHSVEYVRVWGTRGLLTEFFGSVHVYMLPLAAVLGILAALSSYRAYRAWLRLGRQLDRARLAFRSALRGSGGPRRMAGRHHPSAATKILLAWPALTAAQVALYLAQENLEAIRVGLPAPGFGAITGVHQLAPVVHAVVALTLLLIVAAVRAVFRRRRLTLHRVLSALNRVLERLRSERPPRVTENAGLPPALLAVPCRQRPPPLLIAV